MLAYIILGLISMSVIVLAAQCVAYYRWHHKRG
jgi:hypothetical protein